MKIVLKITAAALLVTSLFANDVQVFSTINNDGKITPKTIEAEFKKLGFYINDNRDMNKPFILQFKESDFKVYNLFTLYKVDIVKELSKNYPQIGLFAPMSMSIYTKKGENKIHVASLTSDAIAKIAGIPSKNKELKKLEKLVHKALQNAMPHGSFEKFKYMVSSTDKKLTTDFELELDQEEWEDEKDEFQMSFEGELKPNGFVQAGFTDVNYDFINSGYKKFDFYDTESICKLPVIYKVAKTRPEAGAFAPCSLYMYKIKGEDMMHIGFPNVYNWMSSLSIEDKEAIGALEDAQKRMVDILISVTE
ncbi:MAG: DUF302 domain-containing protein [Campylobacterota bacterium]|nr:DUF302 domain-containing protein [Campylobacterota bacterium]